MREESMNRRFLRGLALVAAFAVLALSAFTAAPAAGASTAAGAAIPEQARSCVVHGAPSPVAPTGAVGNGAPGPWPSMVLVKRAGVQVLDIIGTSLFELPAAG